MNGGMLHEYFSLYKASEVNHEFNSWKFIDN